MAQKGSLRRKAVGAGALGLVALGIWLGQYFPGFGLGKGIGFGTGSSDTGSAPTDAAAKGAKPEGGSTTLVSVETPGKPTPPPPERLRVIIDGERFILASGDSGTEGEALDPTEIAQRTKSTTGDDQGIRIRIERTKRATTGARQSLLEALDAAGITHDSRHESQAFLDVLK